MKKRVSTVLRENPEIILEALRENQMEVFKIVQAGAKKKNAEAMQEKFKAFLDSPLKPELEKDRPMRGYHKAPVTIVVYSDFECSYCAKGAKTLENVLTRYGNKVRIYYKHNPLKFHKNAFPAAVYFEAIARQNQEKAWRFHDLVYENQKALKNGDAGLKKLAASLNVDIQRLETDLKSGEIKKRIEKDMEEARRFGLTGTPSFLLNGAPVRGALPKHDFFELIEIILSSKKPA